MLNQEEMRTNCCSENVEREHMEDLDIDGTII
jgi:hypothetical protein